jgi:hypothetical protein
MYKGNIKNITEGKRPLEELRLTWEDITTMNLI